MRPPSASTRRTIASLSQASVGRTTFVAPEAIERALLVGHARTVIATVSSTHIPDGSRRR